MKLIFLRYLVGGFRGTDIVGRIDDGSFFWVSDNVEGNGCLLIIKWVLFPFLFKNQSSKCFSQMKIFFSLLTFRCKNVIHRSLGSFSFGNPNSAPCSIAAFVICEASDSAAFIHHYRCIYSPLSLHLFTIVTIVILNCIH